MTDLPHFFLPYLRNPMNRRFLFLFVILLLPFAAQARLATGTWRGVLELNDTARLPFNFEVAYMDSLPQLTIINASERIVVKEVRETADSIYWKMPVFDSEFRCAKNGDKKITGVWGNKVMKKKTKVLFTGVYGDSFRFEPKKTASGAVKKPAFNMTGRWQVTFKPDEDFPIDAVGEFVQKGNKLTGTFLTEQSDYRYLEGVVYGNEFWLSCFDGAHPFLFHGTIRSKASITGGEFWFSTHNFLEWKAVRNEKAKLRDPEKIVHVSDTSRKLAFVYNNMEGKPVSLNDERYKNKVVIVQLMGSWCPNCLDETKVLVELYKKYQPQGLEIIALAYERNPNPAKARQSVERLRKHCVIPYEILITGRTGREGAQETVPMLSDVVTFPTTLYLDRTGKVRKVYTGFSGPATGAHHEQLLAEMNAFIQKLLAE